MELRLLRSFVAVAEHLSFHRAAEELGLTQPALSLQMRALEEEIGVPLLRRDRQGTALTYAGAIFQRDATAVLDRVSRAAERMRRVAHGASAQLRVGFISTAATTRFLPALISRFRAVHPHVELTLQNMTNVDQIIQVGRMALDIAFLRLPLAAPDMLELLPVYREPHALLLPSTDPLSKQKAVHPGDLAGRPLLMYSRQGAPGYHDFLMRTLTQRGLDLDISQEVGEMYTLASLVSVGVGIAIAPISTRNYNLPGVVVKTVGWLPPADIAIGFHRDNTQPACRMFIDMAAALRSRPAHGDA